MKWKQTNKQKTQDTHTQKKKNLHTQKKPRKQFKQWKQRKCIVQ